MTLGVPAATFCVEQYQTSRAEDEPQGSARLWTMQSERHGLAIGRVTGTKTRTCDGFSMRRRRDCWVSGGGGGVKNAGLPVSSATACWRVFGALGSRKLQLDYQCFATLCCTTFDKYNCSHSEGEMRMVLTAVE